MGQNKDVQNHIHSKSTSLLIDSMTKYVITGLTYIAAQERSLYYKHKDYKHSETWF